jgi:aryl-alcohol dehydrogenase-like predicted oxidoreductase
MRFVEVGGVRLSAIGLGTWQFGSREWGYGSRYADEESGRIVDRALGLGINLIDTAEIYGFGASERIVGRAIAGRRDEAFLATKIFPVLPVGPIVGDRARRSARRLGVDSLDLYQVHQPNPLVPDAVIMPAMRRLVDEGLVRHVGVSNYSLRRWQAADAGLGGSVLSNQVRYSLVDRRPEGEVLPWAQDNDRIVIAYSPLGQGLLSARYDAGNRPGGVRAANSLFLPENLERATELLGALRAVASAHGATPAQVALAWVVRRPNVVAIPGASSVSQLERNAEAADLELTDEEDERLTAASDRFSPLAGMPAFVGMARERLRR